MKAIQLTDSPPMKANWTEWYFDVYILYGVLIYIY
jgi:hypothetical protein